jgi:hemerythrin superfamily protein
VKASPAQRRELWPTIREKLVSHERGEVRELYPELRARPELAELADHHDDEARELDDLIDRIEAMPYDAADWGPMFETLAAAVLRHANEEEKTIFPRAQTVLGADKAKEIDVRFRDSQNKIAAQI